MKDKGITLQEIIKLWDAKYPDGIDYVDTDSVALTNNDVNEYKGITTWAAKAFMNGRYGK
jgi:hypothetical protein